MDRIRTALRQVRQTWSLLPCLGCDRRTPAHVCEACLAASAAAGSTFVVHHAAQHAELNAVLRIGRYFRGPELSPFATALLRFKYRGDRAAGHLLRLFFQHCAQSLPPIYDVVVPIPLHRRRLRERGYNQAAWLARGAAGALRVRLEPRALTRVKDTLPQATASRRSRRALHDAFVARATTVEGRAILLVDDVYTTGATAADAGHALLAVGAATVDLAVLLVAGAKFDE